MKSEVRAPMSVRRRAGGRGELGRRRSAARADAGLGGQRGAHPSGLAHRRRLDRPERLEDPLAVADAGLAGQLPGGQRHRHAPGCRRRPPTRGSSARRGPAAPAIGGASHERASKSAKTKVEDATRAMSVHRARADSKCRASWKAPNTWPRRAWAQNSSSIAHDIASRVRLVSRVGCSVGWVLAQPGEDRLADRAAPRASSTGRRSARSPRRAGRRSRAAATTRRTAATSASP